MRRMTTALPTCWSRLHSNAMASCSPRCGALPSAMRYHYQPVHTTTSRSPPSSVKVPLQQRCHFTRRKRAFTTLVCKQSDLAAIEANLHPAEE